MATSQPTLTEQHSLYHHLDHAPPITPAEQQHYEQAHQQARLQWLDDAILVLDTNILLGYEQLPLQARARLYAFLEREQDRIYLSDQVYREYTRHLEAVRLHQRQALRYPRPTPRQQALRPALADYLDRQAALLRDYPALQGQWQAVYANSGAWLKRLQRHAQAQVAAARQGLTEPDLSALVEGWQRLPRLTKSAYQRLKKQVRAFTQGVLAEDPKGFADAAAAYGYRHPDRVFPGLGDVLHKRDDGLGDYVIYHELLQWALAQAEPKRPIIFLTHDYSKGDWMTVAQTPYWHYYHHFYTQAQTHCHILPAQEWLQRHAGITFTPLLQADEAWQDAQHYLWQQPPTLTPKNTAELLAQLYPNRKTAPETDWDTLLETLAEEYEIKTVNHLKTVLLEQYPRLIQREQALQGVHDRTTALRLSLDMEA